MNQKGSPSAEIQLTTVKDFYGENENIFDLAVEAVVRGCVLQYFFDNKMQKFIRRRRNVYSEVTETFDISTVSCTCSESMCYHIGALALNSGFDTPIFSYDCTSNEVNDISDSSECAPPQPLEEVYVEDPSGPFKSDPKTTSAVSIRPPNKQLIKIQKSSPVLLKIGIYCDICDTTYANWEQLKIHETKMHPVRCFAAPTRSYSAPARTVNVIPTFQCPVCLSLLKNNRELRRHTKEMHPPTIDCPVCSIPTPSKRELRKHMLKEHAGALTTSKCPICSTSIQNIRELQTHMKQEHPDHADDGCNVCGKFFFSSGSREHHVNNFHKYKCDICTESFSVFESHQRHLKTHLKKFSCLLCFEEFDTGSALRSHRSGPSCLNKPKHRCKSCNEEFRRVNDLDRHTAVVHNAQPASESVTCI